MVFAFVFKIPLVKIVSIRYTLTYSFKKSDVVKSQLKKEISFWGIIDSNGNGDRRRRVFKAAVWSSRPNPPV